MKDSPQKAGEIVISPMSEEDIPTIFAIEERAYEHGWTKGILRDCFKTSYLCWTVRIDEQIIGYGIISIAAGESHLLNLAVDPKFQNRGLGRRVLRFLMNLIQQQSVETLFLEVRESNKNAIALYLDEGFNQIGVRNDYYPTDNGFEDAIIMACSLEYGSQS